MLGFVSAHIPWNAISNLELRRSYNALRSELVLPSASTLSNICRREYTLTVDAIKKQLPSTNKVSLALDGWTSTNKLAITSVIAYYMDRNWALREVQLAFDEVNSPIFSYFESSLRITGQGSAYGSTPSRTFEGSSWSFRTDWRPFTWNYHRQRFLKLLDDSRTTNYPWGLRNRVARIEKPYTMHGARHSAVFGCIHEQSGCKRPHQVLGSPWARSAIWREWKHRHWEESKTSKRGQC
jgi:hypothetical protein